MQELTRRPRLKVLLALAAFALPARALDLGEAQVRSALGEPLDARITLGVAPGQVAQGACFSFLRDGTDPALPSIGEGLLNVEHRSDGSSTLRVRTVKPVIEPAVALHLRAACPGAEAPPVQRQYTILLDPRPGPGTFASLPTIAARLDSQAGDTLDSIAAKVFPRDAAARRDYAAALRALNPAIAARGEAVIAGGEAVALPDLKSFSVRAPARAAPAAPPPAPVAPVARRERPARPVAAAPPAGTPAPRAATAPAKAPAASSPPATPAVRVRPAVAKAPSRPAAGSGFVLKLSSAEVDLSRSRQIDERMRAQLRERLLVLDADDQVAALLSMRNSLKQLEARVAELQLKLSAMPAALATASAPAIVPPKAEAPRPAPKPAPPAPAATAAPEPAPAPKAAEPPRVVTPAPPPPPVVTPAPPPVPVVPKAILAEPAAAKPSVPAPVAVEKAPEPVAPKPSATPEEKRPPAYTLDKLPDWLWAVAGLLVVLAALLGIWLWRRSRTPPEHAAWVDESAAPLEEPVEAPAAPSAADEEAFEVAPEVRAVVASDADLETRLSENSGELRRRYIEERFPEIQNRTIVLEDPASVVKGARLFYEDGAISRSVELLRFATEDKPGEVRVWLALFEIFRLERLTGEYAALAQRFRESHATGEHWRKVQFFGREIDPGNALYREAGVNTLETIGPREAKRLAAGLSSVASIDPIVENWLEAPMDFENEVLANDLRKSLMSAAALSEQDLVPNPMPALRSVEMFTVA